MLEAAAPAVAAMWPERAGTYCCPLCGKFLTEDQIDELSPDHAPPSKLPGRRRVTVLTCDQCNHNYGATVDAAMIEYEELRDARRGTMTRPRRGFVMTAEGQVAVNLQISPASVLIFGVPEASSKKAHAAWVQEMETQLPSGGKLSIGTVAPRYPRRLAEVGWLRAAYLIAFAAFGYRYAFSAALEQVRAQLLPENLDRVLIKVFAGLIQGAGKSDAAIRHIREPERLRSITVQMGEHLVFLPVLGDTQLYARLEDESSNLGTFNFTDVPWPVPPTYGMDSVNQG
jgi:hypothetical protein